MRPLKTIIVGGGPAGMGCAYRLSKAGYPFVLIDENNEAGGLCRTINFHGYLFDIGGHRFLSKYEEINRLWREIMKDDLISVKRLSRIYYKKRYFNYPLSFLNTFWNLGPLESVMCVTSYLQCRWLQPGDDTTFEGWIVNRFGRRLFNTFFKTYTEKVWAMDCQDISADWARQRIQGLSLRVALQKAIGGMRHNSPKTLSETFLYPRTGPGEFYRRLHDATKSYERKFQFNSRVKRIYHNGNRITAAEIQKHNETSTETTPLDYLFSSIHLPVFINLLSPAPDKEILLSAQRLQFRSFLVVNIILDKEHLFPDQWIYVHSPEVTMGRIQNYKNWSPAMVVDAKKTSLGLEYFCSENDTLWNMSDIDLIRHAMGELEKIGIVSRKHLINGFVVRAPNVYPIYTLDYQKHVNTILDYLCQFSNFKTMGRMGLFRYDNSDRSLLTGMYAAEDFIKTSGNNSARVNYNLDEYTAPSQ